MLACLLFKKIVESQLSLYLLQILEVSIPGPIPESSYRQLPNAAATDFGPRGCKMVSVLRHTLCYTLTKTKSPTTFPSEPRHSKRANGSAPGSLSNECPKVQPLAVR